ncbi:MAG: family 1 glycosylhydrolase [Lachnospira sp.]|nr:family 1 glycosylhydrolase [Lachnospira sp.]
MNFPKDFIWGTASSSYQIEGGYNRDGKGLSVWDVFCRNHGVIAGDSDGKTACCYYDKYEEDIKLMADAGIKAYRFSISWPRIFPNGDDSEVNQAGIKFYDNVVNCCLKYGITPHITLFHWDLPQSLEERGGWLSDTTIKAFVRYAEVICKHFSDRVEYFSTINEPQIITKMGYYDGLHAPGFRLNALEVLDILHGLAKAHALAVTAMRQVALRPVKIGFSSTGVLCYPSTGSENDIAAARKTSFETTDDNLFFCHHIFCDAVIKGAKPDWDNIVPKISALNNQPYATEHLNKTWSDCETLNPAIDFLGLNVYNGHEVDENGFVERYTGFPKTALKWPITPKVIGWGTQFMYERYKLPIFITENGLSCNDHIFLDSKVHDPDRIDFLTRYLDELSKACERGNEILGYFHWSFTDNFEWHSGYDERFGLVYIDYPTQRRIPKDSYYWYAKFISLH